MAIRQPRDTDILARSRSGGGTALQALQLDGNVDERERSGGDAGDSAGLAEGLRADALERLAHLAREAADGAVFEPIGDGDGLGGLEAFDGLLLLLQVAGELDFGLNGASFVAKGRTGDGGVSFR